MTTKRVISRLRNQVRVMSGMLEAFPDKHIRFGIVQQDGTCEEPTVCADWCYACKLEKLQSDVDQWKSREAAARDACVRLAQIHGHFGSVLARLQAGEYTEAIELVRTEEARRHTRTARTVVSIIAVEDNSVPLSCCDDESAHVWVQVLTWSGRRAYLTGASAFIKAIGETAIEDIDDLKGTHFYADLPFGPPPAEPEVGEYLEWPDLELCPPMEQVKEQLGTSEE